VKENQVLINAIKETRWTYDIKEGKWKKEVVIIKDQQCVKAFQEDEMEADPSMRTHLRDECRRMRERGREPPCYFDDPAPSSSQSRHSRGIQPQQKDKRCGGCGQLGHISTSRKCPKNAGHSPYQRRGTPGAGGTFKIKLTMNKKSETSRKRNTEKQRQEKHAKENSKRQRQAKIRLRGDPFISMQTLLMNIIKQLRSLQISGYFTGPVSHIVYPDYPLKVKTPMDLKQMENKNKAKLYKSREEFLSDVRLLQTNSLAYNGPAHAVSQAASIVVESAEKAVAENAEHFSEIENEIKLKRLSEAMIEVIQYMKGLEESKFLQAPVSKKAFPKYYDVVKQPMDLTTLEQHAKSKKYYSPAEFWADAQLIVKASIQFNKAAHPITKQAEAMIEKGKIRGAAVLDPLPMPERKVVAPKRKRKRTGKSPRRRSSPRRTPSRTTPRRTTPRRTTPRRTSPRRSSPRRTPSSGPPPGTPVNPSIDRSGSNSATGGASSSAAVRVDSPQDMSFELM